MDDLRTPSGYFFLLLGLLLCGWGLISDARPPMSSANVNLYSGAAMLLFGAILLWLAYRKPQAKS